MMSFASEFVFYFLSVLSSFLVDFSQTTIDVNFPEYLYIADHLTAQECRRLVAALHFHTYEIPKEIDAAERRLPEDATCIDLLLHWNSTPREGRGLTHVEICHRLNQIGREDLARWLSKTVFHEISKDLNVKMGLEEMEDGGPSFPNVTEGHFENAGLDEAAWWNMDSVLSILIVFGLFTLAFGIFYLCFLCCTRPKLSARDYRKLCYDDD